MAVVLSAQATDVSVNKATETLFAEADTPHAMLALGEAGIRKHIRRIGLYNAKAANLVACCRMLLERHQGQVPREREALEALPGVGRKTANVILNTAFGEPVIAVDTHVFRLANRTRIAPGKTVLEVEKRLMRLTPSEYSAARPPLADPARPLHMPGAQAPLQRMRHRRPVRIPLSKRPKE